MGCSERVIVALCPFGESGQTPTLAKGADTVPTSCQYLMRIGLVAHVPDDAIIGCVEDIVQRDRELDHTKACA